MRIDVLWRPGLHVLAGILCCVGAIATASAGTDILGDVKKLFGGDDTEETTSSGLTDDQIGSGLKEALTVGTERVVSQLGATDGFNADPAIRIPLPDSLKRVQSALGSVGMSSTFDDLELQLNRPRKWRRLRRRLCLSTPSVT